MRIILIFCLLLPSMVVAETVRIRADEWFPMNGRPEDALPGYMIELAERAFDNVDYQIMPWSRAIGEVNAGRADCVVGGYRTDTPEFIFPRENWGIGQLGVYVNVADDWRYEGLASLLDRKVGVVSGYSYEPELDAFIKKRPDIFEGATGTEGLAKNIKMLLTGRVDTVIESKLAVIEMIKKMGVADRVKVVGFTNSSLPMYIACSPQNPRSLELVNRVDVVTRQLRASGELDRIMQKYGLTDWQ